MHFGKICIKLFPKFEDLPVLTKENVLFCLFLKVVKHDLAINTIIIIIIGKSFLHKNRFLKILKNVSWLFHKELSLGFLPLKRMKKKMT